MLVIYFNPLSRQGERPNVGNMKFTRALFQSTLPTRGETIRYNEYQNRLVISIHSPDKGRDLLVIPIVHLRIQFQSTLPTRGETVDWYHSKFRWLFQSTLPTRGETCLEVKHYNCFNISIHSPDKGRDGTQLYIGIRLLMIFQSTLPTRGETFTDWL